MGIGAIVAGRVRPFDGEVGVSARLRDTLDALGRRRAELARPHAAYADMR
jgi:hypothetical protein